MQLRPFDPGLPALFVNKGSQVFGRDEPRRFLGAKAKCRHRQLLARCSLLCFTRGQAKVMRASVDRYVAATELRNYKEECSAFGRNVNSIGRHVQATNGFRWVVIPTRRARR